MRPCGLIGSLRDPLNRTTRLTHTPNPPPKPLPVKAVDDDPWASVSRTTQELLHEEHDATTAPRRPGDYQIEVGYAGTDTARHGVSTELVDLLSHAISSSPERADLWMMRFEMYRSLGMKPEFEAALIEAWTKPRVRRLILWDTVEALWREIAPGEAFPASRTQKLRPAAAPEPSPAPAAQPEPAEPALTGAWQGNRRFADIALQHAGAELNALTAAYATIRTQPGFYTTFARGLSTILQRPSPLEFSEPITRICGGVSRIYLKREDKLGHSPELGNAAAQAHLAALMGKTAVVTGNDVDLHSVALATIAPRFNLEVVVFVRPEDEQSHAEVIARLRALKVQVNATAPAASITHDPREAALRFWQQNQARYHLALSLGTGPRPYPTMVSDFQSLLGRETVLQVRAQTGFRRPVSFVAAMYSEGDAIGYMVPHLPITEIPLYYAEPDGESGVRSSISARAYNGHRREHAWLKASGRIDYAFIPDARAKAAQDRIRQAAGLDLSLEDARAMAQAEHLARVSTSARDIVVLVA
jgi:tryptophan synthase beta chain